MGTGSKRRELLAEIAKLRARLQQVEQALQATQPTPGTVAHPSLAAMRQSEERFRSLFENVKDLIYRYRLWPTPGFEYVSPSATAITGYTPEEHYANPNLGFEIVHPDDRPLLQAMVEARIGFERPVVLRWVRKDGSQLWTEQHNTLIYDASGRPVAIEGIARDITERKQAEEIALAQRDLALDLASLASIEPMLQRCLEAALLVSGMDCGGVYRVDPDTADLRLVHSQGLSADFVQQVSHVPAGSDRWRLVMAGQPLYARYSPDGIVLQDTERKEGLRAFALLPIRHQDQVIASLHLASHRFDQIPAMGRAALELIVAQAGSAIARAAAEEARQQLIVQLQEALAKVKTLSGLLPICASCKKIRDDQGFWHQVEVYIQEHSDAEFTHGICPECAQKLYPQLHKVITDDQENS